MGCKKCEEIQRNNSGYYPYRIGNKEIGYANILIVACYEHAKLTIQRLNSIKDPSEVGN